MIATINENDFAELIFDQVIDGKVWCRLAQVSLKFNRASKRKLIKKEKLVTGHKRIWTELPNEENHGLYKEWYPCGQIYLEYNYLHGKLHGTCKQWYSCGQIYLENNYLHGKVYGTCKQWNENKRLLQYDSWKDVRGMHLCKGLIENEYSYCEGNFVNGVQNGTSKGWYSTSKQMYIINYLNGQKHGEYKWWNQEGQLIINEYYINDVLVTWDLARYTLRLTYPETKN